MNAVDAIANATAYFRAIDLLGPAADGVDARIEAEAVAARLQAYWGADLEEDLFTTTVATDWLVLAQTEAPVFHAGLSGYSSGDESYARLVRSCGEVAPDVVALGDVGELWANPDEVEVNFVSNGQVTSIFPKTKYLDPTVIYAVNATIRADEPRRFFTDGEGNVALLTQAQVDQVTAERDWYVVLPSAPALVEEVSPKKKRWRFGR